MLSDLESLINQRRVEKSIGSESSWAIASKWVDDCIGNHCTCSPSTATIPPLPTRVIDVDLNDHIVRGKVGINRGLDEL